MRSLFLHFFVVLFLTSSSMQVTIAQNTRFKQQDSEHIKDIMEAWNEKAGNYLYESIAAHVMNTEQPERINNIKRTPYELLQMMSLDRIDRLKRAAKTELQKEKNTKRGKRDTYYWKEWLNYVETTTCGIERGSSTGEPHMLTFDGERYDFQNAGDYLLSASEDGSFEIQTQLFRRYASSGWSLNGGVAANVNGDIVEFRGTKAPIDGEVYVNEELITARDVSINLPQGGTLRLNEPPEDTKNRHLPGDRFVVKWPTGEQMRVGIIRNFSFGDNKDTAEKNVLYQLYVAVPACRSDYSGLLGNNDGNKNDLIVDDTTSINNDRSAYTEEELFGEQRKSPEVLSRKEQSCLYIAHPFANTFQLEGSNSLFPKQMTSILDSIRYPKGCVTLADASDEEVAEGRRKSESAGVSSDEMYSTVFDYVYADIDPKEQVNDSNFRQPERTDTKEPDISNDNNNGQETNKNTQEELRKIHKRINRKNPNTRKRPTEGRKPTRNVPTREQSEER